MEYYSFVSRQDKVDSLNKLIEYIYPGDCFDFSNSGLPSELIDLIHKQGFNVSAIYTQADNGDWGTFLQAKPDFEVSENAPLELLEAAIKSYLDEFKEELLAKI